MKRRVAYGENAIDMYSVVTCALPILTNFIFFFNDTATTEIYALSLHDALPICNGNPGCFISLLCANSLGWSTELKKTHAGTLFLVDVVNGL